MIENLFVNGCSFNTTNKHAEINTYVGKMVADHYGYKLYNFARGGRGNKRIEITSKMFFEKSPERKIDTLALIEWTTSVRNDYISFTWKRMPGFSSSWKSYSTADVVHKMPGLRVDENESISTVNHINNLQNYFNLHKIPYIMYFGMNNKIRKGGDTKLLKNFTNFFRMGYSHYQYCQDNGLYVSSDDYHPTKRGHKLWTQDLIKYIDDIRRT